MANRAGARRPGHCHGPRAHDLGDILEFRSFDPPWFLELAYAWIQHVATPQHLHSLMEIAHAWAASTAGLSTQRSGTRHPSPRREPHERAYRPAETAGTTTPPADQPRWWRGRPRRHTWRISIQERGSTEVAAQRAPPRRPALRASARNARGPGLELPLGPGPWSPCRCPAAGLVFPDAEDDQSRFACKPGRRGTRASAPTGAATVAPNPDRAVDPLHKGQERGTQQCGRSGRPRGEADT